MLFQDTEEGKTLVKTGYQNRLWCQLVILIYCINRELYKIECSNLGKVACNKDIKDIQEQQGVFY